MAQCKQLVNLGEMYININFTILLISLLSWNFSKEVQRKFHENKPARKFWKLESDFFYNLILSCLVVTFQCSRTSDMIISITELQRQKPKHYCMNKSRDLDCIFPTVEHPAASEHRGC